MIFDLTDSVVLGESRSRLLFSKFDDKNSLSEILYSEDIFWIFPFHRNNGYPMDTARL